MAYERTWQFLAMQGPRVATAVGDQGAYWLWTLKSWLKGEIGGALQGLWTCTGSSNGTTAALDGVDRWGTVYNFANIPYVDNDTGARGWIVLQRNFTVNSTMYTVYLLLSNRGGTVGAGNGQFRAVLGTAMPTGGTTTADPTMTQTFWTKQAMNATGTYVADTTNNRRYYGGLTTNGDFWVAETLLGELAHSAYFAIPVGTKTNDQFPFYASFSDALNSSNLYPFAGNSLYTRSTSGTGAGTGVGLFYNGGTGYVGINQPSDVVKLDATDISLFDRPAFLEVWNTAPTPATVHSRGRLPDFGLISGFITNTPANCRPVNVGSTISDNGNVVYVTLNQVIVPYNALLS